MRAADSSAVREQLRKILASAVFAKSPRMSRFLHYVVEQTLEGAGDRMKEYTIGIEVFDKSSDFDPETDSTVRTEATKLRARLKRYYETDGSADTTVITIPKGAYVPVLENRGQAVAEVAGADAAEPQQRFPGGRVIRLASIGMLLAVSAFLILSSFRNVAGVTSPSTEARPGPRQVRMSSRSNIPEAQIHYDRAEQFDSLGTSDSITKAIDEYLLCIMRDPGFALAYADLSIAYLRLTEIDLQRSRDLTGLARAAAQKAVELDDSLPAAHHAAARAHVSAWDWKAAEPEFRRALQLAPASTDIRVDYTSNYLNLMGRFEESLELLQPLLASDPTSRILRTAIGGTFLQSGRYDEAIGAYTQSLALRETPGTLTFIGIAFAAQGRYEEALERQQRARALNPGDPWIVAHLAYTSARSGRITEAKDHIRKLREISRDDDAIAVELAGVYSGLGDNELALQWLRRAMEARSPKLRWLGVDQRFRSLRRVKRFQDLLRAVGLPVWWDG